MDSRSGPPGPARRTGPRDSIPASVRQAATDAAAVLQLQRREIAERVTRGPVRGVRLHTGGGEALNRWMAEACQTWTTLRSLRPAATAENVRATLPQNRRLVRDGLAMVSIFDTDGIRPDARVLLANEPVGEYRFGVCPVQMKIVDDRIVLLEGPVLDDQVTLMEVTAGPCVQSAWRYWELALESSYPARGSVPAPADLTPRQHQIVALLSNDLGDDAIAEALGVSVRTVRSDVAAILTALGVRSRFAAGRRLSAAWPSSS